MITSPANDEASQLRSAARPDQFDSFRGTTPTSDSSLVSITTSSGTLGSTIDCVEPDMRGLKSLHWNKSSSWHVQQDLQSHRQICQ